MNVKKWYSHFKLLFIFSVGSLIFLFQNCSGSNFNTLNSENLNSLSSGGLGDAEDDGATVKCDIPDQAAPLLSQTCLGQIKDKLLAGKRYDNFILFEPQYPLFSDSAVKRRWLYLPKGKKN